MFSPAFCMNAKPLLLTLKTANVKTGGKMVTWSYVTFAVNVIPNLSNEELATHLHMQGQDKNVGKPGFNSCFYPF